MVSEEEEHKKMLMQQEIDIVKRMSKIKHKKYLQFKIIIQSFG